MAAVKLTKLSEDRWVTPNGVRVDRWEARRWGGRKLGARRAARPLVTYYDVTYPDGRVRRKCRTLDRAREVIALNLGAKPAEVAP